MACRKLGNHIRFHHKMTQNEYRDKFSLYHNTKLSNKDYRELMREYNKRDYCLVVKENLIKGGINTRVGKYDIPRRKLGGYIKERTVSEVNYSDKEKEEI